MVRKKNYGKIVVSTSSFMTVETFLLLFIRSLSNNFDVFVITNLNSLRSDEIDYYEKNYNFKLLHVPIKRKINLFYDLVSLFKTIILIKKINSTFKNFFPLFLYKIIV